MNSITFSRFRILLAILCVILLWQVIKLIPSFQSAQEPNADRGSQPHESIKPVSVSVFYEALCPDSKNFIVRHLLPAVNNAARLLNISLVPYGKAKTEEIIKGNISFSCQHGPTECLANKIHACAISKISNSILQVRYISCMISENMIPELIGENCAKKYSIDWKLISQCAYSHEGNNLLKKFGQMTDLFVPRISFVPTILINNRYLNQAPILKNFFKEVCMMFRELPEECITSY